jgi:hypothetical protein
MKRNERRRFVVQILIPRTGFVPKSHNHKVQLGKRLEREADTSGGSWNMPGLRCDRSTMNPSYKHRAGTTDQKIPFLLPMTFVVCQSVFGVEFRHGRSLM